MSRRHALEREEHFHHEWRQHLRQQASRPDPDPKSQGVSEMIHSSETQNKMARTASTKTLIADARERNGLSLSELAVKAGLSYELVTSVERDGFVPTDRERERIAHALARDDLFAVDGRARLATEVQ